MWMSCNKFKLHDFGDFSWLQGLKIYSYFLYILILYVDTKHYCSFSKFLCYLILILYFITKKYNLKTYGFKKKKCIFLDTNLRFFLLLLYLSYSVQASFSALSSKYYNLEYVQAYRSKLNLFPIASIEREITIYSSAFEKNSAKSLF